jgi:chain length determinant protein (polysaccharide antigen chain regulator)
MTGKESPPPPQSESTQYSAQPSEEGMSFIDFMEVLIRKKGLIFLIAATSTLLSIGYVLSVTPVYKARIGFLPPQKIILPESFPLRVMKETNKSLYKKFLARLQSYSHREQVFKSGNFIEKFADNKKGPAAPENLFLQLNSSISLKQNILEKNRSFDKPLYLEMLGPKPEAMADFLNSLSQAAIKNIQTETIDHLLKLIEEEKRKRIADLEEEKQKRIANLEEEKRKRIANLEEQKRNLAADLKIARKLNIIDNNLKHAISGARQPNWFLFGQKALIEEIKRLEIKRSDITRESTSGNLISTNLTQSESEKIKTTDWAQIKIEVASVSQPSVSPSEPVKPRKPLIISIGVLMGLFLGVILAFISDAMKSLKKKNHPDNFMAQ